MSVAEELNDAYTARGWSMRQLRDELDLCGLTTTRASLWAWIHGTRQPRNRQAIRRALALLPDELTRPEAWRVIRLRVTPRVIEFGSGDPALRMISVSGLRGSLDDPLSVAFFSSRRTEMVLKDTGFWRSHQQGPGIAFFDALFDLLALRPGKNLRLSVVCNAWR